MITALIYGNGIYSQYLHKVVSQFYNRVVEDFGGEKICDVAYIEVRGEKPDNVRDLPEIGLEDAREWVRSGKAEVLLVPREEYSYQGDFLTGFFYLEIGLENIYIAHRIDDDLQTTQTIAEMFTPYYQERHLPYLEFHVADHCNLKCADCEHYSGLVEEQVFPVYERLERDFQQLRKFIDEIDLIRILGGEPLLNKDINRYIELAHQTYPEAAVAVVTNGLLLRKMPGDFFDTLRRCNGSIHISYYPVLQAQAEELRGFLESKNVLFGFSDLIETFRKQQLLQPQNDEETIIKFRSCFQKGCVNLYEGKLAPCFLPFTTKYFNEYFGQSLPEDGAIDLYREDLTLEEIKHCLSEPFERCRYCGQPVNKPWHVIHQPSILEDWVQS